MAVQFILGAAGTGKSSYIYEELIRKSEEEAHPPLLLLLPEQSNMAAEQEMVKRHPRHGTMDVAILSFSRLAFTVFDELNIHTRDILDDYGKSMVLMKVLREQQKELSYYGNMQGKNGFLEELKSVFSEFYQYQVTEQVLENTLEQLSSDQSLFYKLKDLQLLLHAFEKELSGSYMVAEQLLSLLAEVAGQSRLLRGADIYFDGFTGFTPVQYRVIEELMKLGGNLYFSFTMEEQLFGDNRYGTQELFSLSKQSVDRLCKLAEDNRTLVLPHVGMKEGYRVKGNAELQHLESQLFRFPYTVYTKSTQRLQLIVAEDARQEASFVARYIKQQVMEKKARYRDFAVVMGDVRQQSVLWKEIFEGYGIPYFLDYSEPVTYNPIVEILRLLMEVFRSDFSYEAVFALLKSDFFELDFSNIYQLENYVISHGVRGYSWWSKPFSGNRKGLGMLNETRRQFMECIEPLTKVFEQKRQLGKEYIMAIYNFMVENHMAERLLQDSIALENQGDLRTAKAYAQVYDKFLTVLDKTMDILGEEKIERDSFFDVFLAGLSDMHLGLIPSTLDQVVVGDLERTRLHQIKTLFVVGVNEGVIPAVSNQKGILAGKDREKLKELKVTLAADSREEIYLQQFYFYLQVTQASQQLVISYRKFSEAGEPMRPSYYVNRLQTLFANLQCDNANNYMEECSPASVKELKGAFARALAEGYMEDASIPLAMDAFCKEEKSRILGGYLYDNTEHALDRTIAKRLYGKHMVHSVSRLETYSGCAYHFFLQYGLKLQKREEYQIATNHIGTILHGVMERFFVAVKTGTLTLETMTDAERNAYVEQLTKEAAKEENETIFDSSFRNRHQLEVLIRIAKRSVEHLCRHLAQGKMEPVYFEKNFSPKDRLSCISMALEDEMTMGLSGIVDRVDIKETKDAVYVKVIDYKSGAKDIDFVKMYEGKQLQLTVYMSVMLELLQREYPGKRIVPTGMYYYHIYDPIIEEADEEQLERKRIESSRLSGLVNASEESRQLMDGSTGTVTPVRYKKDGGLDSRNGALVTEEELQAIATFVRGKMEEIGNGIAKGDIRMNPQKGMLNSPCNLCDYKSVCRFEPGLGGNAYQISSRLEKGEAKARILESGKGKKQEAVEDEMDGSTAKDY